MVLVLCGWCYVGGGVKGRKRKLYAMSLAILDDAVEDIMTSLTDTGLIDNTIVVFA